MCISDSACAVVAASDGAGADASVSGGHVFGFPAGALAAIPICARTVAYWDSYVVFCWSKKMVFYGRQIAVMYMRVL